MNLAPSAPVDNWPDLIRPVMRDVATSGIVEVFDYGRDRQGLIPLWVGEGDLPTPPFIIEAAKASLDRGETFYTYQRGIPELREAIARYMTRVYGAAPGGGPFSPERFFVTIGGMHALEIATRLIVGPGDEALIPSPAWPNFDGALALPARAPCSCRWTGEPLEPRSGRARGAVTPATAILFNSPANPTGFVATRAELVAILDRAPARALDRRRRNLRPPHLRRRARALVPRRDGARRQDPVRADLVEELGDDGLADRLARGAAGAGRRDRKSDPIHDLGRAGLHSARGDRGARGGRTLPCRSARALPPSRDIICDGLAATGRVRFAKPEAAFYLFCAIDGEADSRALALRLVDEAGVGVAPGAAFGPGGEGYLRICFARDPDEIAEATRRFARWLAR